MRQSSALECLPRSRFSIRQSDTCRIGKTSHCTAVIDSEMTVPFEPKDRMSLNPWVPNTTVFENHDYEWLGSP